MVKQKVNQLSVSEKAYDVIRTRIQNGTYLIDARIPSVADISVEFNIAHVTAFRIIRRLADAGYVESSSGKKGRKGTFVTEKFPTRKPNGLKMVETLIYPTVNRSGGDTFWVDILNAMQRNLSQNRILTTNCALKQEKYLAGFYRQLEQGNIAAVIACQFTPDKAIDKVVEAGIPLVLLNYIIKRKGVFSLLPDYERIGRESAEMMVKGGYEKFYFYMLPKKGAPDPQAIDRRYFTHRLIERAFSKRLNEIKEVAPIHIHNPSKKQHQRFVNSFLVEKNAALFTISGGTAQLIYEKMLIAKDSRINNHGLIWIEDYGADLSFAPALSGWRLNIERIGKTAVDTVKSLWDAPASGDEIKILPVEWVERNGDRELETIH